MSFLSKVIFMNLKVDSEEEEVIEKPNLFTNNFKQFDSATNKEGINYSSYAIGDEKQRTVTHTTSSFSSSSAFVYGGFSAGKEYEYSVKIDGDFDRTFLQIKCFTRFGSVLYDSDTEIGVNKLKFNIPSNTNKILLVFGTAGGHKGSTIFSNISLVEI